MASLPHELSLKLRSLSGALQQLHASILDAERQFDPGLAGLRGLDRLANDPSWSWLRAVSSLIADIDHVLATGAPLTPAEVAAVSAHVRGVLFGQGDRIDEAFLARYRPLLQISAPLASRHGELKRLLEELPAEPENESERLHARHSWAERCRHRLPHPG